MSTDTPIQEDLNDFLNMDDSSGLMRVLTSLFTKNQNADLGIGATEFIRLTDYKIETLFRDSTLIQKIIKKYPMQAKSIGYIIKDKNGEVIESDNEILLEAFKEASIYARLYSRCYLRLYFDGSFNDAKPITKKSELVNYEILFDLYRDGDFYEVNTEKVHYHRIIEFIGVKSYAKYAKPSDANYADSILQGLFSSLNDYFDNKNNAKYLLENLSYLTVGIKNLGNMTLSTEGQGKVFNRLTTMNMNRNIHRTIAYDKESEIVGFITQTLAGVKEIIDEIKDLFVSETEYPYEQLFGETAKQGMGSGIQNQLIARFLWAEICTNWVINNWLPNYKVYFERTLNLTKSNYKIEIPFKVSMTYLEQAELENIGADRLKKLIESGVIIAEEGRTGYKGDKYSLNIELDDNLYTKEKAESSSLTKTNDELNEQPGQLEDDDNENADAEIIPDEKFWDALANISFTDLDEIAEKIIDK